MQKTEISSILTIAVCAMTMLFMSFSSRAAETPHPVRVWGDLGGGYRVADYAVDSKRVSNTQAVAKINASSYLWEPWIALVSGGLSLSSNMDKATAQSTSANKFVDGNILLNVFPTSRFPFKFYANRDKNEMASGGEDHSISRLTAGVLQRYVSVDGRQSYSGGFDHMESDGREEKSFSSDTINLNARRRFDKSAINGVLNYGKVTQSGLDDSTNYAVTGRYSLTPLTGLSLENLIATSQIQSNSINSAVDIGNDQLSSFVSWQPRANDRLSVTGSIRLSNLRQEDTEYDLNRSVTSYSNRDSVLANVNQGMIYRYTPNITINESINAAKSKSGESYTYTGSESIGGNYRSDSIALEIGQYSWGLGSGLSRSHGDDLPAQYSLANNVSHSLMTDFEIASNLKVQAGFNQSATYGYHSAGDNNSGLNHSMTMNWLSSSFSKRSSVRFLVSDSRSYGNTTSIYQLANVQISQNFRLNREASIAANITLQKNISVNNDTVSGSHYGNGDIKYINNRFQNVRNLIFSTELRFRRQVSDYASNNSPGDEGVENSWQNVLIYRVGLFTSRLDLSYVKNEDGYDRLFKIQFTRKFGDL